jgi:hypothetical protein
MHKKHSLRRLFRHTFCPFTCSFRRSKVNVRPAKKKLSLYTTSFYDNLFFAIDVDVAYLPSLFTLTPLELVCGCIFFGLRLEVTRRCSLHSSSRLHTHLNRFRFDVHIYIYIFSIFSMQQRTHM